MSFEDQIRAALDGAAANLRQHLDADLRAFAQEVARVASEDRQRVAEAAAAEARTHAEAQLAQYREAAQKHTEHLKHVAETQISDLRKALEELRAQAQQQLEAARRIAQGEVEKARTEIERARGEVERAHGETAAARGETAAARAETAAARAETAAARGEAEQAKAGEQQAHADAGKAQAAAEQAHAAAEQARTDAGQAHADAERARIESEQARAAAKRADEQVAEARRETELAQAEASKARTQMEREMARVQAEIEQHKKSAATEAEEVLIARLAAADAVSDRKTSDAVDRARTDSHQSELARAARLADAVRNLDEARGLSEVLERLAECAGHEVDRAAVLLVKGNRLGGWRLAGFGPAAPAAKSIDLSFDEAGLAGAVVRDGVTSGAPTSRAADEADGPGLPPFAGDAGERHAMALPVRVGGEVVAVLYADAPRLDAPSSDARWPAILEVLVRHASRVLEAMTVQQAAGLSLPRPMARGSHAAVPGPVEHAGSGGEDIARRYARLLLSEIRMYHEPIVDAGRRSRDLMSRLRGEIERARRIYEAHVPPDVSARGEYFDQELVRTLADGDRTLLGGVQ